MKKELTAKEVAEYFGVTRQYLQYLVAYKKGFPEPCGTGRPIVTAKSGKQYIGNPCPVYNFEEVLKWADRHNIKSRIDDEDIKEAWPVNPNFDNSLAQKVIRLGFVA